MKNKTKALFLTLSVALIALSILTINLYSSQKEIRQSLSSAEMRLSTDNKSSGQVRLRAAALRQDRQTSAVQ